MSKLIKIICLLLLTQNILTNRGGCQACYDDQEQRPCNNDIDNISSYTMHMSVHPHLDAFWIFDFQSYYNPSPNQGQVRSYFASNRFNSVKQIFDTTLEVLKNSKRVRQTEGPSTQKAHRSFFNSQMGFFKRWYFQQPQAKKQQVKMLLKTKYWQIVGGGYVQHDQGCAYYDDIIQNFQTGLRFLKEEFGYHPKAAISADSFGHSQSTLAILAHLGIQGFFVQRSDEHILLKNKTQFLWKAKSANGKYYGALPTHIRWAIHGFQDQFIGGGSQQQMCQTKWPFVSNMNRENQFLKKILKSPHIMRYFGHDFQRFDDYSYNVIEGIMEKFSLQKCKRVTAVYGNPSQYFTILMGQVFNKAKPLVTRQEDIMPIWDYDSGLYWTGYYTTDPYHKKNYRDAGRYLYAARKAFAPAYISYPKSQNHNQSYRILQQFAETVSYLQHHDGISGTSKYQVMDKYEIVSNSQIKKIKQQIFQQMFQIQYPPNTNNPIFDCSLEAQCEIPNDVSNDIYLKVFRTGDKDRNHEPIIIHVNQNQFFEPDCDYEIICLCTGFPCPCDFYLYPKLNTYSLIRLKKVQNRSKDPFLLHQLNKDSEDDLTYNSTHITIKNSNKLYHIGYKRLNGDPTPRNYEHLSRYGDQMKRSFSIRSGKYALGSSYKTEVNLSKIKKVLKLQSDKMTKYIISWARDHMKTIITIPKQKTNQWKIQTLSSAETGKLEDLYLEVNAPHIINNQKFYTDSNGWLVMKRQLFKHQDYQAHFDPEGYDHINGNSYPMTAFAYIENEAGDQKLSINTDRPQGVIAFKAGTLWVNFDRLSSDDGKWVYQTTYRTEYQKFTHYVTVNNREYNQRKIQKVYDQPLIIQGNSVSPSERVPLEQYQLSETKIKWQTKTGINNVKFQIKPWNDSSLLLRVFNMRDVQNVTIQLFSAEKICTFLTTYYGNQIKFADVYETTLGGNMKYQQFIANKWNWDQVVNLTKENQIFDKVFGQTIVLRPLQIRTFVFEGVKIETVQCKKMEELKYTLQKIEYKLNTVKLMKERTDLDKANQLVVTNYLLNQDHCKKKSPINDKSQRSNLQPTNLQPRPEQTQQPQQQQQQQQQPQQPQQQQQLQQQPQQPSNTFRWPNFIPAPQTPQPVRPQPVRPEPPIQDPETIKQSQSGLIKTLEQKIKRYQVLSKQQKQAYFSNLLTKLKSASFSKVLHTTIK